MWKIYEGQILVRRKALLPKHLQVRAIASPHPAWLLLQDDVNAIEEQVRKAEWHFFWISQETVIRAIGLSEDGAIRSALRKAVCKMESRYNAAEITRIKLRRISGLYFCSIQMSSRHIQQGAILGLADHVGLIAPAVVLGEQKGNRIDDSEKLAA